MRKLRAHPPRRKQRTHEHKLKEPLTDELYERFFKKHPSDTYDSYFDKEGVQYDFDQAILIFEHIYKSCEKRNSIFPEVECIPITKAKVVQHHLQKAFGRKKKLSSELSEAKIELRNRVDLAARGGGNVQTKAREKHNASHAKTVVDAIIAKLTQVEMDIAKYEKALDVVKWQLPMARAERKKQIMPTYHNENVGSFRRLPKVGTDVEMQDVLGGHEAKTATNINIRPSTPPLQMISAAQNQTPPRTPQSQLLRTGDDQSPRSCTSQPYASAMSCTRSNHEKTAILGPLEAQLGKLRKTEPGVISGALNDAAEQISSGSAIPMSGTSVALPVTPSRNTKPVVPRNAAQHALQGNFANDPSNSPGARATTLRYNKSRLMTPQQKFQSKWRKETVKEYKVKKREAKAAAVAQKTKADQEEGEADQEDRDTDIELDDEEISSLEDEENDADYADNEEN